MVLDVGVRDVDGIGGEERDGVYLEERSDLGDFEVGVESVAEQGVAGVGVRAGLYGGLRGDEDKCIGENQEDEEGREGRQRCRFREGHVWVPNLRAGLSDCKKTEKKMRQLREGYGESKNEQWKGQCRRTKKTGLCSGKRRLLSRKKDGYLGGFRYLGLEGRRRCFRVSSLLFCSSYRAVPPKSDGALQRRWRMASWGTSKLRSSELFGEGREALGTR